MLKMFLIWLGGGIWCLSNMILHPKNLSCDRIFQMEAKKGSFDELAYNRINKKQFMISSDYGYYLSCEILDPENCKRCLAPNDKQEKASIELPLAILCHGFSTGKYRSLIYAEIFLKLGFKVLIYDHRNHGLSGKAFTSMGYYEKYDLMKLVDWCYDTYGSNCKIITHGESMGAATALLHLGIDKRVVCTIADCAYSDLKELLIHQIQHYYHIPRFLISLENLITYIRAGFWYGQVSPIDVVRRVDTPILFIHGKRDKYVPTEMSKKMYNIKKDKKALYLVARATHAQSCMTNRREYEKIVGEFINKYLDIILF